MFERILRSPRIVRLRAFIEKYRAHVPTAALIFGFIWDTLTLGRPDRLFENSVLLAYFVLAGGGIVLMNLRVRRGAFAESLPLLALVQFSFGSLASGLLVLYGRSGTFAGSFFFFLLLGGFLVGNEFLRTRYARLRAQIGAFYMLLLAYLVLVIPVALGEIGTRAFLLSGLASAVIIVLFLFVLFAVARRLLYTNLRQIAVVVAGIYLIFNGLYFLNILPPVPLALRHVGVYHSILRAGGEYHVTYENPSWFEFFRDTSGTFTKGPGESAYCFSSVFAPTGLTSPIYHRWEMYDEKKARWITQSRISFSISGGNDTGFRGYTVKTSLPEGLWRCDVETGRGTLIGRTAFLVVAASSTPPLSEGEL